MGMVKRYMEEMDGRGFSHIEDKQVCYNCFQEDGVRNFIKENATGTYCEYCGAENLKNNIAMPIEDVIELIVESLSLEYADPGEELPYESREGGYQGKTIDTWDLLLYRLQIIDNCESPVFKDICSAIHTYSWCKKDYFGMTDSEQAESTWEKYVNICKKKKIKSVSEIKAEKDSSDDHWEEVTSPANVFSIISKHITKLGLIKVLPKGKLLYRVRLDKKQKITSISEIGTPPTSFAKYPNRMSAAGVPMFYAGEDDKTAILETWDCKNDSIASIGEFETTGDNLIIDFSNIPDVPSLFDPNNNFLRETIKFLNSFIKDFSKPIEKDGREHIEYIATQILTDFFRYELKPSGELIQGICYPSSKREGNLSYVFFWGHEADKKSNPNLLKARCALNNVRHKNLVP
jgi:hypothetical protein